MNRLLAHGRPDLSGLSVESVTPAVDLSGVGGAELRGGWLGAAAEDAPRRLPRGDLRLQGSAEILSGVGHGSASLKCRTPST